MPKRKDLKKILVVGAGPIIIGQACEFDYSGTQACKALKDEGYKVILINSNPATIMTDPDVADKTYIEPITVEALEKILKKERPDAILPTMGGQTALNLAMEAEKKVILKKYKIELIGAKSKAISNAEDRKKFRQNMLDIGLDLPKSKIVKNIKEAEKAIKPAINYLMKIKCKKIILGCTELPIAIFAYKSFKKIKESKIFIDPNLLLAEVSMKKYKRL